MKEAPSSAPQGDQSPDIEKDLPVETDKEQRPPVELDSLERFKWEGKEWSPKDLKNAVLMQSDYTKKTKELAEERKYVDNLSADLTALVENPSLLDSFKQIYPKKYHAYVEGILAKVKPSVDVESEQVQARPQAQQLPDEVRQALEEAKIVKADVEKIKAAQFEKEVAAIEAQLGTIFSEMRKKYPLANEEAVIARAQSLIDQKYSVDEKVWAELWKSGHEANKKMFDNVYKTQISQQKQAHAQGSDIGAGGGIPGQAPKKMSFKEATEAAIRDFSR
jgi:hypothetical protein